MRKYLDGRLFKPRPVMEALDEAMVVLFALTEFHDVSFNLFLKFTEGQLTFRCMYHFYMMNRPQFLEHYHKRSNRV